VPLATGMLWLSVGRSNRRSELRSHWSRQPTRDDRPIEKFEPDRRNNEQIDGGDMGSMVAQEARQPGEEGPRRRAMYLATVDWAIPIPSFSNSP
jgi:hypothetical protein